MQQNAEVLSIWLLQRCFHLFLTNSYFRNAGKINKEKGISSLESKSQRISDNLNLKWSQQLSLLVLVVALKSWEFREAYRRGSSTNSPDIEMMSIISKCLSRNVYVCAWVHTHPNKITLPTKCFIISHIHSGTVTRKRLTTDQKVGCLKKGRQNERLLTGGLNCSWQFNTTKRAKLIEYAVRSSIKWMDNQVDDFSNLKYEHLFNICIQCSFGLKYKRCWGSISLSTNSSSFRL